MESQVVRCARYARISFDKAGDEHGVANQLADQQRVPDTRGLVIVRTEVDNDISALNGKHRPGYEAVMAAAARREIDVVLVFQTSRFWRNRRERAEGTWILREAGVSLIAAKGPSLDMSTAYGRGMAGLLGEFETMESEVKAERQQLAAFQRAENGQPPVGVRLTGYTMAGVVVECEAVAVRQMFTRFYAGDSLRGIVAWLAAQRVPTRSGRPWNPSSVRTILTNPRYASRVLYRMGAWPPLVEEWLFDAVQAKLSDPRRRKQIGTHRKHLGPASTCAAYVISLSGRTRHLSRPGSSCATGAPTAGMSPAAQHRSMISCSGRCAPGWRNPTSRTCWLNLLARKHARPRMRSGAYAAGWSRPGWTTTTT